MGILKPSSKPESKNGAPATKRSSLQSDFASLEPLKSRNTAGFVNFRESEERFSKSRKKSDGGDESDMDSDDEDGPSIVGKAEDEESKDINSHLSPDDARQQGELAEGVRQIKVSQYPIESTLILD